MPSPEQYFDELPNSLRRVFLTPEQVSMSKLIEASGLKNGKISQAELIRALDRKNIKVTVKDIAFVGMIEKILDNQNQNNFTM
ncbi:hypothetical protein ACQUW5_14525 [Legionella sp. CNM-1927-20]|uniref:hypothetical protein n=1 Tax=Legionella sp. CNM-1927-20 TaxID=3422221 RepID=UPI00403B1A3D